MSSMSNGSNGSASKGSSRQSKRPAPLKMVKPEEIRQYRPPVIIHTYSPKVIHVDPAEFSSLVQSLTGRGQKRKPAASPRPLTPKADDFACSSPSSSVESAGIVGAFRGQDGLMSPRGPLASFDHRYQNGTFDISRSSSQAASAKANASMFSSSVLAAAANVSGPQYSPLYPNAFPGSFPHLFSPLPSPNLLSPNFMAELPLISPSSYQAFDAFGSHPFNPSPGGLGRFGGSGLLPSPARNNAFKDMGMGMVMSRE
jgi:hypothetical protein